MKNIIVMLTILLISGCVTFTTETSLKVIEYKNKAEMDANASCEAVEAVYASYDVFLHFPWERKRAAHIRIKDAAYAKGANAVVMTSNNYGVITDQVQGVAYNCIYGKH